MNRRLPVHPFDEESARAKVLAAEAAWNSRDPELVATAYSEDTVWRNRDEFLRGRAAVVNDVTITQEERRIFGPRREGEADVF